jgi:predicted nucleotidyltransferase
MSLFGSILRDDFGPDSDIDVPVEFHPDHVPGFMTLSGIEIEFAELVGGRKVDMNTPGGISRYYVDDVLAEAKVLHDET